MSAGQGHDRLLREIQADGHIIDLSNSQIKSKCSIPAMKLIRKDISSPFVTICGSSCFQEQKQDESDEMGS